MNKIESRIENLKEQAVNIIAFCDHTAYTGDAAKQIDLARHNANIALTECERAYNWMTDDADEIASAPYSVAEMLTRRNVSEAEKHVTEAEYAISAADTALHCSADIIFGKIDAADAENAADKNVSTMRELIDDVNTALTAYVNGMNLPQIAIDKLNAYALMCVRSTCNKRYDPSRKTALSDDSKTRVFADGTTALTTTDGGANELFPRLKGDAKRLVERGETDGDGADLVQECVCTLFEQAAAHADVNGIVNIESTYTARVLDKHVKIRTSDNACWKDVETSPVQAVFSAVGGAVDAMRAVHSASEKYGYIAIDDDDSGETLYLRYGAKSGIGGTICHGDDITASTDGIVTADAKTALDMDTLLSRLSNTDADVHFTPIEMKILAYRFRGYGYDAIASALKISKSTVRTHCVRMAKKAIDIGIVTAADAEKAAAVVGIESETDEYRPLFTVTEKAARYTHAARVPFVDMCADTFVDAECYIPMFYHLWRSADGKRSYMDNYKSTIKDGAHVDATAAAAYVLSAADVAAYVSARVAAEKARVAAEKARVAAEKADSAEKAARVALTLSAIATAAAEKADSAEKAAAVLRAATAAATAAEKAAEKARTAAAARQAAADARQAAADARQAAEKAAVVSTVG